MVLVCLLLQGLLLFWCPKGAAAELWLFFLLEYPLFSQIQKWRFVLFPWNGSSMMWVWKEWYSVVRETNQRERAACSGLWPDLLLLFHCVVSFQLLDSQHLLGLTTQLHSSGLRKRNNSKRVRSSWNRLHKLWEMKPRRNFKSSWKH